MSKYYECPTCKYRITEAEVEFSKIITSNTPCFRCEKEEFQYFSLKEYVNRELGNN